VVIWKKCKKKIQAEFDIEVILYETPRNFVTYRGESKKRDIIPIKQRHNGNDFDSQNW
jgi:hypothetical protein